MITIIGTGHIYDLGRAMMFLIKNIWPQAVLVELDVSRYKMMESRPKDDDLKDGNNGDDDMPWIYKRSAKYQQKMAEENKTTVGNELLVAVNMGRLVGAEIGFIDTDAHRTMKEMWEQMPFKEKARYTMSTYRDRIVGKRGADEVVEDFAKREEEMLADMRRKYPTLVRKLIDERNEHMAKQIREYSEKYDNIVVVCGDAHVEGISKLLEGKDIRKIRLMDLKDEKRIKEVYSDIWNHERDDQ